MKPESAVSTYDYYSESVTAAGCDVHQRAIGQSRPPVQVAAGA